MITATWRVERLEISDKEYRALKDAGLNTFGDVAALSCDELSAKAKISGPAAEDLLNQIAELTREEERDAAAIPADVLAEPLAPPKEEEADEQRKAWTNAKLAEPWEEHQEIKFLRHTAPTSIEELRSYPKETITPEIAADILGCNPQSIRSQAKEDANALGFPIIVMGSCIMIPRRGFIYFMEYGRASIQHRS